MAAAATLERAVRGSTVSLALLLILLSRSLAAGQATPATAPPPPPASEPPKGNAWNAWENRMFTANLTLSGLFDGAGFAQSKENVEQLGHLPILGEWRAERVLIGGALKFPTPWTYLLGANYNGIEAEGDAFSWMDIRLDIPVPHVGKVKIGRQKVGVSQEWLMPGLDWVFMERSTMNNSFVPQRNVGIRLQNTFAGPRGVWSAGWFNDWFVEGRTLSSGGNQYSARLSYIPIDREPDDTILHVAAALFYKQGIDGKMSFKSRPEVHQSPYFVDTGSFVADHSLTTQVEVMAISGPNQLFGEMSLTPVSAPSAGNPFFYGWYIGASRTLTGEHRTFNRNEGYYAVFAPTSPFSFRNGGLGAWEISGRFSQSDLTDQTVSGGTIERLTGAVCWYPTKHWRLEFNYGLGKLNRFDQKGRFNAFQMRIQFST